MNAKAISEKPSSNLSRGCLFLFGLIFFLAGSTLFTFMFLIPMWQASQASDWPKTVATITGSRIERFSDSDGDSFKPIIEFNYQVEGQAFSNDRYSFNTSSFNRSWAQSVTNRYPEGSQAACFYNPTNPADSVLEIEFGTGFYLWSLFPMIFVAIGVGVGASAIFGWGFNNKNSGAEFADVTSPMDQATSGYTSTVATNLTGSAGQLAADRLDQEWAVPKKLKPESSPIGQFLGVTALAAFWNGIVSVFLFSFLGGEFGWFDIVFGLFLIPFVLVGLALIFFSVYSFMQLFNPKFEIALSSATVPLGGEFDIAWELDGRNNVNELKVYVTATQSATYQQGTNTHTDREQFELLPVVETNDQNEIQFGSATLTIPAGSMHTFESEHNSIEWEIVVEGDIRWWPNIHSAYPFRVSPGVRS